VFIIREPMVLTGGYDECISPKGWKLERIFVLFLASDFLFIHCFMFCVLNF
jgi:hypothetical protein